MIHGARDGLNMYIPHGTPGTIVSQNPLVAQMRNVYSGWHLFIYILDAFLETTESENSGTVDTPSTDDVVWILKIYLAYFKVCGSDGLDLLLDHCSDAATPPIPRTHVITTITTLLSRCCNVSSAMSPPTELLTCCISILELFLDSYADIVWVHLRRETLFPRYEFASGGAVVIVGGGMGEYGYLQQVLLPAERQKGTYPCLIAFLKLVKKLLDGLVERGERDGVQKQVMISCIVFIHSEVFTGFGGWRYVDLLVLSACCSYFVGEISDCKCDFGYIQYGIFFLHCMRGVRTRECEVVSCD